MDQIEPIEGLVRLYGAGAAGKQILEVYSGYQRLIAAWETPVGKEILRDLMNSLQQKAALIERGIAKQNDFIEYNMMKKYADNIANKIKAYYQFKKKTEEKLKKVK